MTQSTHLELVAPSDAEYITASETGGAFAPAPLPLPPLPQIPTVREAAATGTPSDAPAHTDPDEGLPEFDHVPTDRGAADAIVKWMARTDVRVVHCEPLGGFLAYRPDRGDWVLQKETPLWLAALDLATALKRRVRAIFEQAWMFDEKSDERKRLMGEAAAYAKAVEKLESARALGGVSTMLKHMLHVDEGIFNDVDRTAHLLVCGNGVVDLRTGELGPHDPELYMTQSTPTRYDPAATCQEWTGFMDWAMDGNREMSAYLQMMLGAGASAHAERSLVVLYGSEGGNGKSTILETVGSVLGSYANTIQFAALEVDARQGDRTHAQLSAQKLSRFVAASETSEDVTLNMDLVKNISGGEKISIRDLFEKGRDIKPWQPRFMVMLATNNLPAVRVGADNAAWGRLRAVPFLNSMPEERRDGDLKARFLRSEAEGILAWLVRGAIAWYVSGKNAPHPALSKKVIAEWRDGMNPSNDFVSEWLHVTGRDEDRIRTSHMHTAFKEWAQTRKSDTLKKWGPKAIKPALTQGGKIRFRKIKGIEYYIGVQIDKDRRWALRENAGVISRYDGPPEMDSF